MVSFFPGGGRVQKNESGPGVDFVNKRKSRQELRDPVVDSAGDWEPRGSLTGVTISRLRFPDAKLRPIDFLVRIENSTHRAVIRKIDHVDQAIPVLPESRSSLTPFPTAW